MPWDFDPDKPIYIQLVDKIKFDIISGKIGVGEKLSSVRDMAQEAGVNPNTMQRALSELERENLIYSQRTSGRFVSDDEMLIKSVKNNYANKIIEETIKGLMPLGYSKTELVELIENYLREMD